MRMVNGKLAASLVAWRENAFEMKDGKRKMAGFLNRMINRKLSAAFETWQANASEGKDAEALLKKSLMRMIKPSWQHHLGHGGRQLQMKHAGSDEACSDEDGEWQAGSIIGTWRENAC